MADLPLIQLDTPAVRAEVKEKTFPLLWLQSLSVSTMPEDIATGGGNIEISICPMAADGSGETMGEARTVVQTNKLWQAINEVPEVAQAVAANLAAAVALKTWVAARKAELEAQNAQN